MRWRVVLMFVFAIVFGTGAVLAGHVWLNGQAELQRQRLAQPASPSAPVVPVATLVVADRPLRYGMELNAGQLKVISWPANALPQGAFRRIEDVVGAEGRRIVLSGMEPNEPILAAKITGPGQRGTLSALLEEGMGAVTIQVNEVVGVGGFVLPGDRVDVLVTRHQNGGDGGPGAASTTNSYTDVVIRNVRVLAVGQVADDRTEKAHLVHSVTVEVESVQGQKVALAAQAGSLSLILRKAGEVASAPGRRVVLGEIGRDGSAPATIQVRVTRGVERKDYSVAAEASRAAPATLAADEPARAAQTGSTRRTRAVSAAIAP